MITVYDLKEKKEDIAKIQKEIKKGSSGYRTKWGLYGSSEWFVNIKNDNLIITIKGHISDVIMGGHNDFPMFRVFDGKNSYEFERIGKDKFYIKGKKIQLNVFRIIILDRLVDLIAY